MPSQHLRTVRSHFFAQKADDNSERHAAGVENAERLWRSGWKPADFISYVATLRKDMK
ncbi:hypothetical protein [Sphingomonas sp. MMS24-J13]|uniref:hypothetical protein n=1 Tax=Sphingomonas sp. MMS24-J13 TaxID=3238686 RepID=UPI0038513648